MHKGEEKSYKKIFDKTIRRRIMARRVHLQRGLGKGHGKVVNRPGIKVLVVEVNLIRDIGEEESCTFDRGSILCIEVAASCYQKRPTSIPCIHLLHTLPPLKCIRAGVASLSLFHLTPLPSLYMKSEFKGPPSGEILFRAPLVQDVLLRWNAHLSTVFLLSEGPCTFELHCRLKCAIRSSHLGKLVPFIGFFFSFECPTQIPPPLRRRETRKKTRRKSATSGALVFFLNWDFFRGKSLLLRKKT